MKIDRESIKAIVLQVIKELNNSRQDKRILTVYTGGKIGFKEGLQELKKLKQSSQVKFDLLFSETAQKIIDAELVKDILGVEELITREELYTQVNDFDLIVVPVLTNNSCAKLAAQITDTLPTDIIFKALLSGTSVIAAQNAANLTDPRRPGIESDQVPELILKKNKENLETLKGYGLNLIDVGELRREVEKLILGVSSSNKTTKQQAESNYLRCRMEKDNSLKSKSQEVKEQVDYLDKKLLTYNDVRVSHSQGKEKIVVSPKTIITPLAKERASQNGVKICLQQR